MPRGRSKPLLDSAIKKLGPKTNAYIVYDREPGFGVRVTPSGARAWVFAFDSPELSTKDRRIQRRMVLGQVSDAFPVKDARREAQRMRAMVDKGVDPIEEQERQRAAREPFDEVAKTYVELHVKAKVRERWQAETQRILDRYVLPEWRGRAIEQITTTHLTALLDQVQKNNGAVQADRVLAVVTTLFNWNRSRKGGSIASPVVRAMARAKAVKRDRILSDAELRALWTATQSTDPTCFGPLVRCLLLTAQRRDEVSRMRRPEITGTTWTIPADRYKTGKANVVPLVGDAAAIIEAQPRWRDHKPVEGDDAGERDAFVFTTTGDTAFSGFSKCKAKLDRDMAAELQKADPEAKLERWVLHDLRRTAKTLMARAGVRPDISERVLGHVIGGVEGTYDRHSYGAEKLDALDRLANLVRSIVTPPPDNVVRMHDRREVAAGAQA